MEFRERIEHLKDEWPETGLPEIDIYENVTIPYTKEIDEKGKNQYFVNAQLTESKRAFYPYIFISPSKIIYITESEQDTSLDLEKSRKYIQTQILYSFLHQFYNEEIEKDSIIGIGYYDNDSQSECESNYALIHSENALIDYLLSRESANAHLHVSEEASIALESLQNRDASSFDDEVKNSKENIGTDSYGLKSEKADIQQSHTDDRKQDTDSFDESESDLSDDQDDEDSIYIEIPDKKVELNRPEGRYVKGQNGKEIYIPPAITSYPDHTDDDDSIYIEDTDEKQNEDDDSNEEESADEILLDIDSQLEGSEPSSEAPNTDVELDDNSDDVIFFDIDDEPKQKSEEPSETQNKEYKPNFILIDDDTKFHYRSDLDDNQTFNQNSSSYKKANSPDSQYYQSNANNQSTSNTSTESQASTESNAQSEDKNADDGTEHLTREELDDIYNYRDDYYRYAGRFRHYHTQDNRQNDTRANTQNSQTEQAATQTVQNKKPAKRSRISAGTLIVWGIIICFIVSLYYCPFSIRGYGPVIGNDTVESDGNDNTALTMNSLAGYWESDGTGTIGNKHLWIALSNNGTGNIIYPVDIYMKKTLPITYSINGTTINIQTTEEYQNHLNKDLQQSQIWQFAIPVASIKHDEIKVHVTTADGSNQYDVTFNRISHMKYSVNKTYSLA